MWKYITLYWLDIQGVYCKEHLLEKIVLTGMWYAGKVCREITLLDKPE